MKTRFILFISLFCFAFTSIAGESFEGKLTMSGKNTGKNAGEYNFPLFIQGSKMMIQAAANMKVIVDSESGDMSLLTENNGSKMAIKLNLKYLKSAGGIKTFMGSSAPFDVNTIERMDKAGTLTKTSESKTINGLKAVKHLVDDEEWTGEIWMTESAPYDFSSMYKILDIHTFTGFPVSGSLKSKEGDATQEFNLAFEKQTLDPTLFSIGEGVQIIDVSMMLQNQDPAQVEQMIKQMLPPAAR